MYLKNRAVPPFTDVSCGPASKKGCRVESPVKTITETTTFRQTDLTWKTGWTLPQAVTLAARVILAVVWIRAGAYKLAADSRIDVIQSIQGYEIFSQEWATFLGGIIGPLEVAGGVLLLLGVIPRFTGWLSAIVLTLFIIGISQAWARGLVIDCGCFGDVQISDDVERDYAFSIARDILYVVLSLVVAYGPHRLAVSSIGAKQTELLSKRTVCEVDGEVVSDVCEPMGKAVLVSSTDSSPEALSGPSSDDSGPAGDGGDK